MYIYIYIKYYNIYTILYYRLHAPAWIKRRKPPLKSWYVPVMIRPRLFGKLPSRRCLIPWNIQSSIHNSATNSAKVLRKHLLDSRCAIRRCKTPENQIQRSAWWAQAGRRRWTQRELEPSHLASLYLNFDTPSQSELPEEWRVQRSARRKRSQIARSWQL